MLLSEGLFLLIWSGTFAFSCFVDFKPLPPPSQCTGYSGSFRITFGFYPLSLPKIFHWIVIKIAVNLQANIFIGVLSHVFKLMLSFFKCLTSVFYCRTNTHLLEVELLLCPVTLASLLFLNILSFLPQGLCTC